MKRMAYASMKNVGPKRCEEEEMLPRTGPSLAALFFACSQLAYFAVGILCVLAPPQPAMGLKNSAIPSDATCLRATRRADYVTVEVAIGSPGQVLSLLLRLDKVLDVGDQETTIRLFSSKVVESNTVRCNESIRTCSDVILINKGLADVNEKYVVNFDYPHRSVEASYNGEAYRLGLDGEFSLRSGTVYWLTNSRVCYAVAPVVAVLPQTIVASVEGEKLVATQSALLSSSAARDTPVGNSDNWRSCNSSSSKVDLFPVGSGNEAMWLAVSRSNLYDTMPARVEERRTVVELGDCASEVENLEVAESLYLLDCSPIGACRTTPSLPFRRTATSKIRVDVSGGGVAGIVMERDETLVSLPLLANSTEAFVLSLVKLLLITLAAMVTYVRAKRVTAKASWLFVHCMVTSKLGVSDDYKTPDMEFSTTEDAVVGAIAFVARLAVAVYRMNALSADNHERVVATEIAASVLSALHWVLRYKVLICEVEPPLVKLGGSTAIVDASCAVIMAFAEPPVITGSMGKFDPTARLLTALLLGLVVADRCSISASCCGMLYDEERCPDRQMYAVFLMYAGVSWVLQLASVAVILADLFVTPAAYSMSRAVPGDVAPARILLFITIVTAGAPRLTQTARTLTRLRVTKKAV